MSAVSPSFALAVGTYNHKSIIEHWDGTTWTPVAHPNPGGLRNTVLLSVSAVSPDDAWTVGEYSFGKRSLILHWNGTTWTKN